MYMSKTNPLTVVFIFSPSCCQCVMTTIAYTYIATKQKHTNLLDIEQLIFKLSLHENLFQANKVSESNEQETAVCVKRKIKKRK